MSDFTIISHDRQPLRDRLPLAKPLSLFVEPTNVCNFRCTPCVHGSENTRNDLKPLRHMEMALYQKIIGELRQWEGPKLKLLRLAMLGEPLANPEFCEMVRLAKEAGVAERVDTFSNGSLLTEQAAAQLIEYELDVIRVSIYAAEDAHHREVTRTGCTVAKIHDNIRRLRQLRDAAGKTRPYIFVKMFDTYSDENQRFFDLYRGVADEVGLERVHNATNYSGNDLVNMYYRDPQKEQQANREYTESLNAGRVACARPFMAMVINNIGDCLMCTHDPAKGTKIGSACESTLPELWNGQAMFEFRRMHLENRKHENRICAHCDWFKLFPEEDNVDGFPRPEAAAMIKYTDLKVTDRQNLRDVIPLAKPFTVLIEPSSLCNFRCRQCFQSLPDESYFTRNRMNMPMERFQRVIGQLQGWDGPKIKVLKLSLYGEPMMHPQFCEMLRTAREADLAERIETTTNASLLTRAVAEKLVRWQLDYARVSIYASDQEKHCAVTGTGFDIRRIHENLRTLQEVKRAAGSEKPFVSCKMLDAYGAENERFMALYGDVADEVYLDKPHTWIKVPGGDFLEKYYQDEAGSVRDDLARDWAPRVACPMAFTTMAVRSNGDVSPCCVDFIGGTNLGNVDAQDLPELWRSEAWRAFQVMQLENRKRENPSCAHCDFYLSNYYTRDNIDGVDVRKLR